MNRLMQEKWSWVEGSHGMRGQLLDVLTDSDLAFTPGGDNMPLGALCREMGEIEYAYLQSFRTFTQDWSYRNPEAGLETSVEQLKAWFQTLDTELQGTLSAFSNDDLSKTIDRSGYPMPVELQLDVYLQAILIFFGKAVIYLKAMKKPVPSSLQEWVG